MSESIYGGLVDYWARQYGVPEVIGRAVIKLESGFRPDAIGTDGEVGLGQLKQAAAQDVGLSSSDRYNPGRNIRGSMKYLARQYGATGSWDESLARYNQGPSGAYDAQGRLTPKAQEYVEKIKRGAAMWGGSTTEKERQAAAVKTGCVEFALTSPSTWWPALQCAFTGIFLWILFFALLGYAAIVAIHTGG